MAKNKSSQSPRYELLYIISNRFTIDEAEPIAQKVERLITSNGGKIIYQENWGKRRMSYPIKGFQFGYYRLLEYDLNSDQASEIDRYLRLSSDILRHQIIRRKPRTVEEILAAKEEIAKREAKLKAEKENSKNNKKTNADEQSEENQDLEEDQDSEDNQLTKTNVETKIDDFINEEPSTK